MRVHIAVICTGLQDGVFRDRNTEAEWFIERQHLPEMQCGRRNLTSGDYNGEKGCVRLGDREKRRESFITVDIGCVLRAAGAARTLTFLSFH